VPLSPGTISRVNGWLPRLLLLAALALGLGGCAHEGPEAAYPQAASAGWVVPTGYAWPPAAVNRSTAKAVVTRVAIRTPSLSPQSLKSSPQVSTPVLAKTLGDVPRPRTRNELRSVLPGSSDCLARLGQRGVHFRALNQEKGVRTPIIVDGPIAGVRYYTGSNGPLIADCRLVLALALVGGELTAYGVSEVRFSGAYVYRLHALGRALPSATRLSQRPGHGAGRKSSRDQRGRCAFSAQRLVSRVFDARRQRRPP
jgi:hypothetical protein